MANEIIVGMADLKVGKEPSDIITNLGSCIGLCLYSADKKVGGMLHLMMDYAGPAAFKEGFKKAKYADTGVPALLEELKKNYGVTKSGLIAKIFGGGKILQNVTTDIGANNEKAVRALLKDLGIKIIAAKTGGNKGYKVKMILSTGKVECQILGEQVEEF